MRVNIVSGKDNLAAYGDSEGDQAHRYSRTREFMRLVRRLWTEEAVTYEGEHFRVTDSTVAPRIQLRGDRRHPRLYFGGASGGGEAGGGHRGGCPAVLGRAARRRPRTDRSPQGAEPAARPRPPAAGVRAADHHAGPRHHGAGLGRCPGEGRGNGQDQGRRLARPSAIGRGGSAAPVRRPRAWRGAGRQPLHRARQIRRRRPGTTWLVGSAADVARSLRKYRELGITHFVLSDTPYLSEIKRQGDQLLPLLRL